MPKNTEVELKLICTDSSVWEQIMEADSLTDIAVPGSAKSQILDAHYFDTSTYCLQKAKIAYRIRLEGDQWVATVKGGGSSIGGLHERQEWNIIVADEKPNIEVFSNTPIGEKIIKLVGDQVLNPILITRFERRTLDVCLPDGSKIEVAADQGEIIAGHKVTPILEIELELKSGNTSSLFILGAALAKEYPLLPETASKFYRGLILAGLVTEPVKAAQILPPIYKKQGNGAGFSEVLIELITQFFELQQVFFQNKSHPESLHELRICVRRLRSLLAFMGPDRIEKYKDHHDKLRKLGQSLAKLREIDVAYARWKEWTECPEVNSVSKISIGHMLINRRVLEAKKIYNLLYDGYATSTLLDLWATLTTMKANDYSELESASYALERFYNWLIKVTKQGNTIEWANTDKVRKLRLQVKKIRYAVEVFAPVLGDVDQLNLQLQRLQDNLGLLNDIHSTELLIKKLVKETTNKALQLEAGMIIGWQSHEALCVQDKMNEYWREFHRSARKIIKDN